MEVQIKAERRGFLAARLRPRSLSALTTTVARADGSNSDADLVRGDHNVRYSLSPNAKITLSVGEQRPDWYQSTGIQNRIDPKHSLDWRRPFTTTTMILRCAQQSCSAWR